ncbi:MAG: hypothetical protein M1833_000124 [Piccolia ochrophora]|nr:MAG: hypothetical protein M1833_000124 [Piccolia ochrophora]
MEDTFTLLPLHLDSTSKAISCPSLSSPKEADLSSELSQLNTLHRSLVTSLETPVPPPPVPVNPRRSANITRLRESGNTALRKGDVPEALKLYTYGIRMASERPPWEPAGLVRDELAGLYANRAQAHMAGQGWAEAAVDAETSVECKKVGNAKGWWRRAKCLMEMGRAEEARDWIARGLEYEGKDADMVGLMGEVEAKLKKKNEGEGA